MDKKNLIEDEKFFDFSVISDILLRRRKIIIFSTSVLFSIFSINTLNNFFRNPIYQGSFQILIEDPIDTVSLKTNSIEERLAANNTISRLPTLIEYLKRLLFSFTNIIGQSLFSFSRYQIQFSILITVLALLSFFILYKFKEYKFLIYSFINIFLLAVLFGTYQNMSFSPTRHNIYLLPVPFFLIISLFLYTWLNLRLNINSYKRYFCFLPLTLIFIFYSFNFSNSLKNISYPQNLKMEAIKMAKDAEYFLDLNYLRSNISPGYFQSHGDKENNALKGKVCTLEKINSKNNNSFKFFIYSNRKKIDLKDKQVRNMLISNSRGCLKDDSVMEIIKKIDFKNNIGYEQNNFIELDSNRYFYLIEVNRIN